MRCRSTVITWWIFTGFRQCLSAFKTARETSLSSFPSREKFVFYTDKIESIEWQDLVPRQHIDDCFEIHLPHWGLCDLLLSSHQTFSARGTASPVRLLQGALVILVLLQISQFVSFGKWVWILCFQDATFVRRSESESWETWAGAGISVSSRFSVNCSNHSERSRRRPLEFSESLAGFRDQFSVASSSLRSEPGLDDVLVGVLDESCDGDVEDELDNPGTTTGTKFYVLHKNIPLFGQPWLFTADPLVGKSVFIEELS